jgi:DNA-binding response OmpR family regulator
VLVVDDNKVIRQLIRVNLELEGFEVVTAADGAECLEIVHRVRPDVVTLDVVMPRLDGVRTAARLRADADPWTRGVGIVIVSGGTAPEGVGAPGGIDAYLGKPFEPAELVETVRRLAGRRGPGTRGVAGEDADGGGGGGGDCDGDRGPDGCGDVGAEEDDVAVAVVDVDFDEPSGQAAAAPGGS